ncbi:MAG: ATP-binding protein [Acidobacteriota bacterium]
MSFRIKVLVSFLLVIGLSISLFYLWTARSLNGFLIDLGVADLDRQVDVLLPLIHTDDPNLDSFIDGVASRGSFRATVIAPDGKVLADSEFSGPALQAMENHAGRPEITEARIVGEGHILRYSHSTSQELVYVAKPLPRHQGFLRLSKRPSDIENWSHDFRRALGLMALFLLAGGGLAVWLLTRRLTGSVETLSVVARRIGRGDFVTSIPVHSRDEVGNLARLMEQLSTRLEQQLQLLESERNHLNAVLNSMSEGVLVIDKRGRIVDMNPALRTMLQVDGEPRGRSPLEVIRNTDLSDRIHEVLQDGTQSELELHDVGQIFLARIAPIGAAERTAGAVVVFHDITELRRLETVRKDFVTNVSHELKTPLTSIQGYAETLSHEESLPPIYRGFAEKIYRNAGQLSEMIEELFSLARLEKSEQSLRLSQLSFCDLAQELQIDFAQQLEEKGLSLHVEAPERDPRFWAAESYIRRVFRNLVENAVKYTEKGSVTLSMERRSGEILFGVRDTGIGIAEEHLNRIFERFYRVDRDRSRKTGGSGVGLAIVKHIVELHNGRVWAESRLGQGTAVFFTLPMREAEAASIENE